MVPCCGLCNNHKGDMPLKDFLESRWLAARRQYVLRGVKDPPGLLYLSDKVLLAIEQEDYQRLFDEEQRNGNPTV